MTLPDQNSTAWWVAGGTITVLGLLTTVFAGLVWAGNSAAISEVKEQSRVAISDVRSESRTSVAEVRGDLKALNQKVTSLEITVNKLDNKLDASIQNLSDRVQGLVDAINKSGGLRAAESSPEPADRRRR